ncbi:Nucleotidyl transferase AbiEii toxin, Type IV TA system [Caprobacter fermentans]|uniref:Nucleotidyl transferase AbiEii toxin, Type IV TA system n=2 Tax=Caproicibacter fermentans TaxID=2576756 RepID=A0A6N8I5G0_9FIRM|nr:Nucleotidyl transferase AbiEii toxin, Type IV TA system [Caproicibacter fermentans]
MTQYDRITLGRQARELGFVRDTFEKVCRLADILSFIKNDPLLSSCLALKGGTAINLTIFNLPRLSVDIDLDFTENLSRDEMLSKRSKVTDHIVKYMESSGYAPSLKSKKYHALDSFVYEYQNSGGMKDNLKIEINYMLRCHVLPESLRQVKLPWAKSELTVLSLAPIEIFASKIVALLNRTAPRDLYDIHNMLQYGLFDESEQAMLRKCTMLYSAIGSETVPDSFRFDSIAKIPPYRIKTDLLPVLRRGEHFDLKSTQDETIRYLSELLTPNENELAFWEAFRKNEYRPELLFDQADVLERISRHPMAMWKCNGRNARHREQER